MTVFPWEEPMDGEEHTPQSKSHDLESSSDSYKSTTDERQVANWIEVKLIGSGGFGNVTLWRHKVSLTHAHDYYK